MRYARLALGLASVAFVGCGGAGRGGGSTVRDSAGVRIVENAEPSSIAPWRVPDEPALSLGAIEGDSVYEFTRITGALRFDDGRIVIADGSQELRFFDADGRFLHESGGAGEGPGEFQRISHFTRLLHDSLLAFEMFRMRAAILDQNGTFVRSFLMEHLEGAFRLMPVGQFADGGFLVTAGAFAVGQMEAPARVEREPQSVYKYGPTGDQVVELGSYPGREVAVSRALRGNGFNQGYREFGRLTTFLASGDHFMVADNASYEIQVYTVAGALESIFRRRSDPVPITGGDIEALRAPRLSNQGEAGRRALEGYFSDLPDPPETMPHFGSQLHVDRTGNLWVIEYERPTESRHRRWTVFDTQGRWLTTFRLPDGFDLMDVGQDWVLGRVRDEFDVEYIQLYELIKEK